MEFRIITPENGLPVYKNKALKTATTRIFKKAETIAMSMFEIASIIADIDAAGAYQDDGFRTVHEWTHDTFGIKKTLSYNLLKIGREYCKAITTEAGKEIGMKSNLTDADAADDFSVAQISKMLPLGHAAAEELCKAGTITPDMTCRDIEKAVKEWLADDEDTEAEDGEEVIEADAETVVETPLQVLMRLAEHTAQIEDAMQAAADEDTDKAHAAAYKAFTKMADTLRKIFQ